MPTSKKHGRILFNKPSEIPWSRWWNTIWNDIFEWPTILSLGAISFVLGAVGYYQYAKAIAIPVTLIDCLYRSLQIFTMNFDAGGSQTTLPWPLQIALILSPGITGYTLAQTLIEVFRKQRNIMKMARFRNHIIVCGLGRKGLQLVKDFRQKERDVVVLEWNSNNPNLDACNELGAIVYFGDAKDKLVLQRVGTQRAERIIAVCGDDGTNIEIAEKARLLANQFRVLPHDLICTLHIQDVHFWTLLRERELFAETSTPNFRLELFNVYDSGARLLLNEVFENIQNNDQPHLLVIGLGDFGENLIIRAAQRWSFRAKVDTPLPISVVDPEAGRKLQLLTRLYPLIGKACQATPYDFRTDWPEFRDHLFLEEIQKKGKKTHAFICLDNESTGLQAGFWLLNALQNNQVQILVRMQEDTGLAHFLRDIKSNAPLTSLQAFGLLDRTCKAEMFDFNMREALAHAIHEDYIEQAKKEGDVTHTASLAWSDLPENFKESNRLQAEHISKKLIAVRCGIIPWRDFGAENFMFGKEEIEIMARLEHDRWVREKNTQGWSYAPKRNDALKHHPDLLDWNDKRLSPAAREKDRNAAYLLPRLLARAGFQIYCIPPKEEAAIS